MNDTFARGPTRVTAVAGAVVIATIVCVGGSGPALDETALLAEIGFSTQEIQRITRGEIVARTIDADSSSIALAVAGTIDVPAAFYLEKFRDIESFKKTQEVQQIGRLSRQPRGADLASLTLDAGDIDDLRSCRVGDCGVKLDARGIEALARRDAQLESASAAFRQHLATYAQRYLQSGNAALMEYRDAARPVRLADQLQTIAAHSSYLQRRWPTLFDSVFNYTGTLPERIEDFVYWSREKVGPRPIVSVTHVLISPLQDGATAIATKQIYGSHYGNASLGTTLLIDRGTADAPRMRVVYVNRSRVDVLGGVFSAIKRPLVRSRARDAAERMMRGLETRLEKQYGVVDNARGEG